jgi:hypothetical protein
VVSCFAALNLEEINVRPLREAAAGRSQSTAYLRFEPFCERYEFRWNKLFAIL